MNYSQKQRKRKRKRKTKAMSRILVNRKVFKDTNAALSEAAQRLQRGLERFGIEASHVMTKEIRRSMEDVKEASRRLDDALRDFSDRLAEGMENVGSGTLEAYGYYLEHVIALVAVYLVIYAFNSPIGDVGERSGSRLGFVVFFVFLFVLALTSGLATISTTKQRLATAEEEKKSEQKKVEKITKKYEQCQQKNEEVYNALLSLSDSIFSSQFPQLTGHSGGHCVSYPNQFLPALRGVYEGLENVMESHFGHETRDSKKEIWHGVCRTGHSPAVRRESGLRSNF